jgi:hypothetical protein
MDLADELQSAKDILLNRRLAISGVYLSASIVDEITEISLREGNNIFLEAILPFVLTCPNFSRSLESLAQHYNIR